MGISDEDEEEKEAEIEQRRENNSLGRVLEEKLEEIFWNNLALALDITVEVYFDIEIEFWLFFPKQCFLAITFPCFALTSAISGDQKALSRRLMSPKGMADVAASSKSSIKVWVASEKKNRD